MFLNFMKKEEDGRENVDLAAELDRSDKKRAFLMLASRALLQCIREFALDVKELDTTAFTTGLGELAERLAAEEKLSRVEALFESRKSGISTFAQRQRDYLRERETEFKDIIDILSRAMVAMDSDNRDYNHNTLEQSQRIEDTTWMTSSGSSRRSCWKSTTCASRCARKNPVTSPRSSPCRSRLRC
jgi:diguanylate cyclase